MPDVVGAVEIDTRGLVLAGAIVETQLDPFAMLGKEGEIGTIAIVTGAEPMCVSGFHLHSAQSSPRSNSNTSVASDGIVMRMLQG